MKNKILLGLFITGFITVNISLSSQNQNNDFWLVELGCVLSANAENNDCTSSSYGEGAYLKEQNCVITTTVYVFPIGWTTTLEDGFKKCCTIDEGAPPSSSCYGDSETVCHKA